MTDLDGARIVVAGAGAIGSAVALHLLRCGADVLLADPAALGDNASGVAAGMLAPALECLIDDGPPAHYALLRRARDAWPEFGQALGGGFPLSRDGALWLGEASDVARRLASLMALGAQAEFVSAADAAALSDGLVGRDCGGLFTPEDWRLDAGPALAAMRRAFVAGGGQVAAASLVQTAKGSVLLSDGDLQRADWTVLAGGNPSAATSRLAPELKHLRPIKGQLVRFEAGAGPAGGPVVRNDAVYVTPGKAGAFAGATMEPGVDDRRLDPAVTDRLHREAAALFPALARAAPTAMAGVRAATPDGLPLVGQSAALGLMLATGARRNGWLLAPLIAKIIASQISGETTQDDAAFDPRRFDL